MKINASPDVNLVNQPNNIMTVNEFNSANLEENKNKYVKNPTDGDMTKHHNNNVHKQFTLK